MLHLVLRAIIHKKVQWMPKRARARARGIWALYQATGFCAILKIRNPFVLGYQELAALPGTISFRHGWRVPLVVPELAPSVISTSSYLPQSSLPSSIPTSSTLTSTGTSDTNIDINSHIYNDPVIINVPPTLEYPQTHITGSLKDQTNSPFHAPEKSFRSEEKEQNNKELITTADSIIPSLNEPMTAKGRVVIAILTSLIGYISFTGLYDHLNPEAGGKTDEAKEDKRWIASSHSWLDRTACRWFGICGAAHVWHKNGLARHKSRKEQRPLRNHTHWPNPWLEGKTDPADWADDERVMREIPQYVLDYAPLVHLYSDEKFWPGDIAEHLEHITPQLNYTPIAGRFNNIRLSNLDDLNEFDDGRFVYLTSDDNVEERPDWLGGEKNIPSIPGDAEDDNYDTASWAEWNGKVDGPLPDDTEENRAQWYNVGEGSIRGLGGDRPGSSSTERIPTDTDEGEELVDPGPDPEYLPKVELARRKSDLQKRLVGGRSDAPAVLIVVSKGHGIVDAFWFYFYSYNLGNKVLNVRFGNHVGDWEHSLVRFQDGVPKAVFFSEHSFGEAYSYEAVEKIGRRPVIYSATGTHAMYATPGVHSYILPWGLLHDVTDRGPLWDPRLNAHAYTYDYLSDTLRSSNVTPKAPTEWFYFSGHWGDKFYPLSDNRQYRFAGQYHYVNGPLGPRFKNLGRKKVCQGRESEPCTVRDWIGGRKLKRWTGVGQGEEMSEEDAERFFRKRDSIKDET